MKLGHNSIPLYDAELKNQYEYPVPVTSGRDLVYRPVFDKEGFIVRLDCLSEKATEEYRERVKEIRHNGDRVALGQEAGGSGGVVQDAPQAAGTGGKGLHGKGRRKRARKAGSSNEAV